MSTRYRTIATLLMIGAALASTPALAAGTQSVPGNRGPARLPVNRAAPIALPAAARPMPLPTAAPGQGRDLFDLDPGDALRSLGTLTRYADGSVAETPASATLRDIFETEMQGHRADG